MFLKLIAFILLGIGALVLLGMLTTSCPSLAHEAFKVGQTVISWGKVLAGCAFVFVGWLTMKI